MNDNEKLLAAIHRNAEMGRDSIDRLLPRVSDNALKGLLEGQRDEYGRVFIACDALLKSSGGDDSGAPEMAKMMAGAMSGMSAAMDGSAENLASLVIKGTEKGLKELDEALRDFAAGAKKETLNLARTMNDFLKRGRSELQRFTV